MATGLAAVGSSGDSGSTYGYLKLFNEVLALVRHNYVEAVSEDALMQGAYEGLLASLDGESEYLTASQYQMLMSSSSSAKATAGILLTRRVGFIFVAAVLPGSDAEAQGVHSGDRLRSIGTRAGTDLSLSEAQRLLEGAEGSTVKIELSRSEDPGKLDLTIEKRTIGLPGPAMLPADGGVSVVRVPTFREGTTPELEKIFSRLEADGVKRVVLDLRGNAWGDPDEAIRSAALLAGAGTQAIVRKRGDAEEPLVAKGPRSGWRGEMLLLTNPGTALAAEIFVAALSDAGVAKQAGERTLGRAGEREVIPLANGDYLVLTVRKYVSPTGKTWHGEGLHPAVPILSDPDIPFEQRSERQLEAAKRWFAESAVEGKAA
jgi:carboxyl-terminal processing protease